jgi:hypothetical protein
VVGSEEGGELEVEGQFEVDGVGVLGHEVREKRDPRNKVKPEASGREKVVFDGVFPGFDEYGVMEVGEVRLDEEGVGGQQEEGGDVEEKTDGSLRGSGGVLAFMCGRLARS